MTKRDYYNVSLPDDTLDLAADGEPGEEYSNYAIYQARENARLYVIPANWEARYIGHYAGEFHYRVIRTRS